MARRRPGLWAQHKFGISGDRAPLEPRSACGLPLRSRALCTHAPRRATPAGGEAGAAAAFRYDARAGLCPSIGSGGRRVRNPFGGPDLLRTDKEDLTLATPTTGPQPSGETPLSTVPFPIYRTNPQQDPVIATCYMGDYNQIASNGIRRIVSWGDNRNIAPGPDGRLEHQADVFSQAYP